MFTKIVMVLVLVSGDGKQYRDFVGAYDTPAECEKVRVELTNSLKKHAPPDFVVWSSCVKPVNIHSKSA